LTSLSEKGKERKGREPKLRGKEIFRLLLSMPGGEKKKRKRKRNRQFLLLLREGREGERVGQKH